MVIQFQVLNHGLVKKNIIIILLFILFNFRFGNNILIYNFNFILQIISIATEAILDIFKLNFESTEAFINTNKIYPDIENLQDSNVLTNIEKKKILEDQLVKLASMTLKIFTERIAFIK